MSTTIHRTNKIPANESLVLIGKNYGDFEKYSFNQKELDYIKSKINNKQDQIIINQYNRWIFIQVVKNAKTKPQTREKIRKEDRRLINRIKRSLSRLVRRD